MSTRTQVCGEIILQCSTWSAQPDSKSLGHSTGSLASMSLKKFLIGKMRMMSQVPPRIHGAMLLRAVSLLSQVLCVPRSNLAALERDGDPQPGLNSASQAGQSCCFWNWVFLFASGGILVHCRRNWLSRIKHLKTQKFHVLAFQLCVPGQLGLGTGEGIQTIEDPSPPFLLSSPHLYS